MTTATAPSTALPLAATEGRRVPFIRLDAAYPELMGELLEVVERVAHDAAFTLGPEVEDFERNFAAYSECEEAIGVSSGTMALELALRALGIGPGDEVIVPTYTFIATAEAVSTVGAVPVLVDIDPDSATITAEIVERALTPRTRCVIPVHLFGRTVDMDPILELCRPRGIAVIEDACQAHGARYRGKRVGSLATRAASASTRPRTSAAGATAARSSPTTPRWQRRCCCCARTASRRATTTNWSPAPTVSTRYRRRSSTSSCAGSTTGTRADGKRP